MADGDINGFDDADVARIGNVVRIVEHQVIGYPTKQRRWGGPSSGSNIIFGRATSAISGAASLLTPTAFTFVEALTDDATVTPHTQIEDTEEKAGVNEWPDGYGVDSIVCMSYTKGEWHLVWAREACST